MRNPVFENVGEVPFQIGDRVRVVPSQDASMDEAFVGLVGGARYFDRHDRYGWLIGVEFDTGETREFFGEELVLVARDGSPVKLENVIEGQLAGSTLVHVAVDPIDEVFGYVITLTFVRESGNGHDELELRIAGTSLDVELFAGDVTAVNKKTVVLGSITVEDGDWIQRLEV